MASFGAGNEHPGYASEHTGSDHLVDLLQSVQRSACAKDTMVIVIYVGGQWDHVYGLRPVSSRDARVQDPSTVFAGRGGRH